MAADLAGRRGHPGVLVDLDVAVVPGALALAGRPRRRPPGWRRRTRRTSCPCPAGRGRGAAGRAGRPRQWTCRRRAARRPPRPALRIPRGESRTRRCGGGGSSRVRNRKGSRVARNVYVTALEPGSGKSAVVLGLAEVLSRRAGRLGLLPAADRPRAGSGRRRRARARPLPARADLPGVLRAHPRRPARHGGPGRLRRAAGAGARRVPDGGRRGDGPPGRRRGRRGGPGRAGRRGGDRGDDRGARRRGRRGQRLHRRVARRWSSSSTSTWPTTSGAPVLLVVGGGRRSAEQVLDVVGQGITHVARARLHADRRRGEPGRPGRAGRGAGGPAGRGRRPRGRGRAGAADARRPDRRRGRPGPGRAVPAADGRSRRHGRRRRPPRGRPADRRGDGARALPGTHRRRRPRDHPGRPGGPHRRQPRRALVGHLSGGGGPRAHRRRTSPPPYPPRRRLRRRRRAGASPSTGTPTRSPAPSPGVRGAITAQSTGKIAAAIRLFEDHVDTARSSSGSTSRGPPA